MIAEVTRKRAGSTAESGAGPAAAAPVGPVACRARRAHAAQPDSDDAVRLQWCRQCSAYFAICRSCDRGHEHCSPACAAETRRTQLREIRRRYRRSPAGREAHREQERRRRRRLSLARAEGPDDTVGDQPSQVVAAGAIVEQRDVRIVTVTPLNCQLGQLERDRHRVVAPPRYLCCHRCKATKVFIAMAGWARRPRGSPQRRLDRQITMETLCR